MSGMICNRSRASRSTYLDRTGLGAAWSAPDSESTSTVEKKTVSYRGRGLLTSYVAAGTENVPIFITADNAETEIRKYLESM